MATSSDSSLLSLRSFVDDIKSSLVKMTDSESGVFDLATFGEDLGFFTLVASTDEDIDLVVKSLKVYAN